MPYLLNPFTGQFDYYSGGTTATYSTFSAFPASATDGALAVALDTDTLYVFNLGTTTWFPIGKPGDALSVGTYDTGSPSADGIKINASQAIIAQSASASNPGMVNTTTQSFAGNKTFTGAISASNLSGTNTGNQTITLTGDVTGSGTGSFATTLATVNGNVGSFTLSNITVNAKGLITAASSTSTGNLTDAGTDGITVTGGTGAVIGTGTSLSQHVADTTHNGYLASTDWNTFNNKQTSGNYITALTGDVTASGPGSVAATLSTVNVNTGSFGSSTAISSFTVNGKGLITAASTNAVIAPAGTLTGTILASNVVTSSLTTVGTIGTGTWQGTAIATGFGGLGVNTTPANGAIPIGTGAGYSVTTLTAGTGITITNGSGSITIANAEGATGDISPASFSLSNNISSAANVTGLAFANASVRGAWVWYSITVSASSSFYEAGTLQLVQNGAGWYMSQNYTGIDTGVVLSVTTAGQIQYVTPNFTGFSSGVIKFRAIATST